MKTAFPCSHSLLISRRVRGVLAGILACAAFLACDAGSGILSVTPVLPLDTVSNATDLNGFQVNPLLGAQLRNGDPTAYSATVPAPLVQGINRLSCEPYGTGAVGPGNPQTDPTNWYSGSRLNYGSSLPCTRYHVTTHSGNAVFGHVNWYPVTLHGTIYWGGKSDESADDDYNFDIATPNNALGEDDRTLNNDGRTALVHSEFDSDEAIDPLLDNLSGNDPFWWKQFKNAVDAGDQGFIGGINGKEAIAIGLYSMDCAYGNGHNGCGVELHPLYIMAIHLQSFQLADRWVLFAFNNGDQGYAGRDRIPLESNNSANSNYNGVDEQYSVLLPIPQGVSGCAPTFTDEVVRIVPSGNTVYDAAAHNYFAANFIRRKGEKLDFRLRYPDLQNGGDHYVIMGDITLNWGNSGCLPSS
jgi:hypothetical protein